MVLPFISAGLGILSSVGGFMGQQAQTRATNKQRLLAHSRMQNYYTKGFDAYSRYNMKKAQFASQMTYNKEAYGDTVFAGGRKSEQLGRQNYMLDEQARTCSSLWSRQSSSIRYARC